MKPPSKVEFLARSGVTKERVVDRYDGQTIWLKDGCSYECGSYLGGGAAGVYVFMRAVLMCAAVGLLCS